MKFKIEPNSLTFDSGRIKIDNIMKSINQIGVVLVAFFLVILAAGIFAPWYLSIILSILALIFIIAFCLFFNYFAKNDPDRLHDENYLIQRQKLEINSKYNIPITTETLTRSNSPKQSIILIDSEIDNGDQK